MKIQKFMNLLREVINLIVKFFSPFGIKDPALKMPDNIKKMGYKIGFLSLGMTIISLVFAFMLKITNLMIEYRLILLGIMFFMLYKGKQVVESAFFLYKDAEGTKFEQIVSDEMTYKGAKIIGKVSDKVMKFDTENDFYRIMTNEEVINSIKNYLQNLWRKQLKHLFEKLEIISVFLMLIFAIVTNTEISQKVFIPMVIVFIILSFFSSAYISMIRDEYYYKNRRYNNQQDIVINDLLRVPNIVKTDLDMRIDKLQKVLRTSNKNVIAFYNKMNKSQLICTIIEVLCQYGIIIFSLMAVDWNSINLSTITEISATLIIVETALSHIRDMARTLNSHSERITVMENEENDVKLILEVYYQECEKTKKSKQEIDEITIKPFEIKYSEESENDKPFTLISHNNINIKKGEVVVLSGVSGSGKSTFMKLLTERIKLEKNIEIPSTSKYLFYDEKMVFGSLSLYEELFCCDPNPNFTKMKEILERLHLWQEIKCNCVDVWRWMREKKFNNSLSNGQKQRLVLAKMLYWLDEDIDVVVLDECTSGLDDKSEEDSADAERILEYIVKYCNDDKKRIVVISTHQNISGVQENLIKQGFTFKNLRFKKEGEKNLIKQI